MAKYKAVNAFIFAGSFSIGVMKAGFDLEKVLEISDAMPKQNAFYFIKNYPKIPVITPSEWENDAYLMKLKEENIDLMCCNCPCSSLSSINRNASVDGKNNVHFYRLFDVFEKSQPKVFVVENAPTLVKLGFPIIQDLVRKLSHLYYITVIHDMGGNHGVPMQRMRTMLVGWRKDYFKAHPLVDPAQQQKTTSKDVFGDIWTDTTDDFKSSNYDDISSLYKYTRPNRPFMTSLAIECIENGPGKAEIEKTINASKHKNEFATIFAKQSTTGRLWDKSPFRAAANGRFPSISSVQQFMHPVQDRTLNVKELKRLMGYPDDFDFTDPGKECKVPVNQAIAQGVPVNFGKWIAEQAALGLDGKLKTTDSDIVYQDNIKNLYSDYDVDEFLALPMAQLKKGSSKKIY